MMKLPKELLQDIASRAKTLRLESGLTQFSLAKHSGVSFGSIKRFERTGKIALESLLKIALALNSLEEFDNLFIIKKPKTTSLDAMLKPIRKRKRGVK